MPKRTARFNNWDYTKYVNGRGVMKADAISTQVQALMRINFFSKREMAELPKLLLPDEQILAVIAGVYTAGTAVLCVTSKRMMLVDKKMIRLSFEDVRFESIREINFSQQAIMASIKFYYAGREMQFRSWYKSELRMLAQLVQQKMFEVREKLHAKDYPTLQQSIEPVVREEQVEIFEPEAKHRFPSILHEQSALQLDKYLSERLDRWKKATRFAGTLSMSAKAGRQVLKLETSQQ